MERKERACFEKQRCPRLSALLPTGAMFPHVSGEQPARLLQPVVVVRPVVPVPVLGLCNAKPCDGGILRGRGGGRGHGALEIIMVGQAVADGNGASGLEETQYVFVWIRVAHVNCVDGLCHRRWSTTDEAHYCLLHGDEVGVHFWHQPSYPRIIKILPLLGVHLSVNPGETAPPTAPGSREAGKQDGFETASYRALSCHAAQRRLKR
ncbi:hypothetical protein VTI74DRAFT_1144 [Chaetomium olivicolor]